MRSLLFLTTSVALSMLPATIGAQQSDRWKTDFGKHTVRLEDDVRAYPLQILIWHEIVNDVVGSTPVSVTYCPLCNSTLAFDRRFEGNVLDFGTTGRLRHSDMVMYDRQTESWWQQATGEGIDGEYAGARHRGFLGSGYCKRGR